MINQRKFLGISLARRRNRRWLLVAYWAAILVLVGIGSSLIEKYGNAASPFFLFFFILAVDLAGVLGGEGKNGIVRQFQGRTAKDQRSIDYSFMTQEDIAALKEREKQVRLDERDENLRNAVHYKAYAFLRGGAYLVFPALYLLNFPRFSNLAFVRGPLLWILLIVLLSLPQSILLWTEPDMEAERD
jgi:hypothetical protein